MENKVYRVLSQSGREHLVACLDSYRHLKEFLANHVDEPIAAVITDPPYSSGARHAAGRQKSPVTKYAQTGANVSHYIDYAGDAKDQRSWTHWCESWMADLRELAVDKTYLMVFTDWRQLPSLSDALQAADWLWKGSCVWDKTEGARAPNQTYFRHQAEFVLWGTAGATPARFDLGRMVPGVFRASVGRKIHVNQKPAVVFEWLASILYADGVVLDPFAGSMTSLEGFDRAGRQAVCVERDSRIVEQGLKRLEERGFEISFGSVTSF